MIKLTSEEHRIFVEYLEVKDRIEQLEREYHYYLGLATIPLLTQNIQLFQDKMGLSEEEILFSFINNLSENAIRPFAVGRKNWLFNDSVSGANASAVVYTMVEMAKAHDLNIYGNLKFLLDHQPTKEMIDD